MKFKTYIDVRNYLESFIPLVYGKEELGLKRIENLLEKLGNPQTKFKSVLIAGTAGKGSTAFYIARLLQIAGPVSSFPPTSAQSGQKNNVKGRNSADLRADGIPSRTATRNLKIGLHVSPHLVDIRERMQINGKIIPMKRFIGLVNEVLPVVENIGNKQPNLAPSYFEILVALTFLYFAQEKVDWAVVEVGLGGRLDATNVLVPEVAVVTNVGLDHTEILGKTIEKIAWEKAGIIKRVKGKGEKGKVVTGATGKALKVIEKVARLASATLIVLNSESKRAKSKDALLITLDTRQDFKAAKSDLLRYISSYYYAHRIKKNYFAVENELTFDGKKSVFSKIPLDANLANKNLALLTVLSLGLRPGADFVNLAFNEGMPGRFETIDRGVVLDGAHNPDKVRALIAFFNKENLFFDKPKSSKGDSFQDKSVILVVAFKRGKAWKKMIDLLLKNLPVVKVIATEYQSVTDMGLGSAVPAREVADYVKSFKGVSLRDNHSKQLRSKRSYFKGVTSVVVRANSQEAVFEAIQNSGIQSLSMDPRVNVARCLKKDSSPSVQNDNRVLVTGSLYLVGEARTLWELPKF